MYLLAFYCLGYYPPKIPLVKNALSFPNKILFNEIIMTMYQSSKKSKNDRDLCLDVFHSNDFLIRS